MGISTPQNTKNIPEEGNTTLKAITVDGTLYIVDQDGKLIKNLLSCSLHSKANEIDLVELSVHNVVDIDG